MADTIAALLAPHPGDSRAIGAPGRDWLTQAELRGLCERTTDTLHALGIDASRRVAIVLDNGPEMAAAFIAVACTAVTAPLNPAYREEEFDFYLSDLNATALIVAADYAGPALAAARKRQIAIVRLRADERIAGRFTLQAETATSLPPCPGAALPGPDDVALVLHTSGTTSRPKIVPLLQRNLVASAPPHRRDPALTPAGPLPEHHAAVPHPRPDRGGAEFAGRRAAAIVCTPGFNALAVLRLARRDKRPTWYTAVPTMHQAILARGARNARDRSPLTAALHPLVVRLAAAAGDGRAGGDLRRAGDRKLRHDRSDPPDGLESAAAGANASRDRSASRPVLEVRDRMPPGRAAARPRRDRRSRDPRAERHAGLRSQSRGERQARSSRSPMPLVPHR